MGKGHSGTVDFTGQGMSFLLIWLIYCYLFWFLHSRGETP